MSAPVDIVDRRRPVNLHGVTWHATSDAMLDKIADLCAGRDVANIALLDLARNHPGIENDPDWQLAVLALL